MLTPISHRKITTSNPTTFLDSEHKLFCEKQQLKSTADNGEEMKSRYMLWKEMYFPYKLTSDDNPEKFRTVCTPKKGAKPCPDTDTAVVMYSKRSMPIEKMLKCPSPIKPCNNPASKSTPLKNCSSRVLTSSENLAILEEKQRKKAEELKKKEERKEERLLKKNQKEERKEEKLLKKNQKGKAALPKSATIRGNKEGASGSKSSILTKAGRPVVIHPHDEDILDASVDSSTSDQQDAVKHDTNPTCKDQQHNYSLATLTGNTSLHAIWSQKPCHKYVAVIQNFKIYHGSFHSLKAKEYLNDEIVNGYLGLLVSKFDGVFAINSYLVTAVITKRQSEMCKTLFHKHKLGSKKKLLGMYNENRNHWVLVCIDLERKQFFYLNPLGASTSARKAYQQFRNYFNMRYESGVEDKLCLKGYCIKQCDSIQKDGYNCGVIALKLAEQLCQFGEVDGSVLQKLDFNSERENIGMELLSNLMDMTNVCTLCGESEKNDSISGQQWVQCDRCDCWQHVDCTETARQQFEYKDKSFFCLTCANDAPSFTH